MTPRPPEDSEDFVSSSWQPSKSWADDTGISKSKPGFYRHSSSAQDDGSFTPEFDRDDGLLAPSRPERPFYSRAEQRTIAAKNLPERISHQDIINFVRGGLVLDVYLRSAERSASISFVEGSAAQDFMNHVKRNDIYVHGKRVSPTMTCYKRHK